jgi:small subunit ribosomal protein S21
LDSFHGVFSREFAHNECHLTVGCHLNGSSINPLHVLRLVDTSTVHFHNKFCVYHSFSLLSLYADDRHVDLLRRVSVPRSSGQIGIQFGVERSTNEVSSKCARLVAGWGVIRLAEVRLQEGESLENALRRFKRKVQQEDIIKEVRRHSFYLKPGEKKRVKQALARKRARKKSRKESD